MAGLVQPIKTNFHDGVWFTYHSCIQYKLDEELHEKLDMRYLIILIENVNIITISNSNKGSSDDGVVDI